MDNETAYVAHELGKAEEYIKDLESKLAVAVDALKFYAQPYSWCRKDESPNAYRILPHDREETVYAKQTGGKLARQVLKELGDK